MIKKILLCLSLFASGLAQATDMAPETERALKLFVDVFKQVREEYADPVSDARMVEAALTGMLSSLDPHSTYLNEKEAHMLYSELKGEFEGIGIDLTKVDNQIRVLSPIDDTPGARAGLKPGDVILAVDGLRLQGKNLEFAAAKLRGEAGTPVKLLVQRGDNPPQDFEIKRDFIRVTPVVWEALGDVAFVRIRTFNENTLGDLRRAVQDLKQKMKNKIIGVILDLRNNPGGIFAPAPEVAGLFLKNVPIVTVKGRHASESVSYKAGNGNVFSGIPMVILVNEGTASSAEIVAAALQDNQRAIILGMHTFGKGSVQTVYPTNSGRGAIRITTAKYVTPKGRFIQSEGITPDIIVPQKVLSPEAKAPRREKDLIQDWAGKSLPERLKATLFKDLPKETIDSGDYQKERAFDLLVGLKYAKNMIK